MAKLTSHEIESELKKEGVFSDESVNIPSNAHSKFKFEIKENISDLLREIEVDSKKNRPQERHIDDKGNVSFSGGRDNPITGYQATKTAKSYFQKYDEYDLVDPDDTWNFSATVRKNSDNELTICTATSDFVYKIKQNSNNKGCVVEFDGPINALLAQQLLPNMTYKEGTLQGKFIDAESRKDLTPYMSIDTYCLLRSAKKDEQNPQDEYGIWVNRQFNNEIPVFPGFLPKNMKAQKDFEEGKQLENWRLEEAKERVNKHIKQNKKLTPDIKEGIAQTEENGYKHVSRTPKEDVKIPAWMRKRQRGGQGE